MAKQAPSWAGLHRLAKDRNDSRSHHKSLCLSGLRYVGAVPPIISTRNCREQALALKTPVAESMSVMAIFQQLGRRTLPIKPFQEKRDADADDKDWPDPMGVETWDHTHA